jgi:RNA polymerase sigma-70 factor (ECF subfamily)
MIGSASVMLRGVPFMDDAVAPRPRALGTGPGVPADAESTQELVLRARSGDQAAVNDLMTRYETRVRRWAHGRLPSSARGALETRDLVQDTLFKVFQKLPAFEPRHPGAFRDYVWTTLWNLIRDIARSQQRRGPSDPLASDLPASSPSPLEEAMGSEVFARYEAAMERLRPEEREAIIARIELGLSHAEVAEALGKPSVAAAHMAVSRALVRLAEEMAHDRRSRR